jgi:hypothetical protein
MAHDKRLLLESFKFLEAEAVLSAARMVSRLWRQVVLMDELWLHFLLRDLPKRLNPDLKAYKSTRFAYYCLLRRGRYQYFVRERMGSVMLVQADMLLRLSSPMAQLGYKHSALLLSDENVILCGGKIRISGKSEQSSATCYLYLSESKSMRQIDSLSSAKNDVSLLEREGKVYGFGGWCGEIAAMRRKYREFSSVDVWERGRRREERELPVSAGHIYAANMTKGVVIAPQKGPWTCYLYEPSKSSYTPLNLSLSDSLTATYIGLINSDLVLFTWGPDGQSAISLISSEKYYLITNFEENSLENAAKYQEICYIPRKTNSEELVFTTLVGLVEGLEADIIVIS